MAQCHQGRVIEQGAGGECLALHMPCRPRVEGCAFVGNIEKLRLRFANLGEDGIGLSSPAAQGEEDHDVVLPKADEMLAQCLAGRGNGDDILDHLRQLPLQIGSERVAAAKADHPDFSGRHHRVGHRRDLAVRNGEKRRFKIGHALRDMRLHGLCCRCIGCGCQE
ncbi:hypothetical protein D3C73_787090 [compost metagenome]